MPKGNVANLLDKNETCSPLPVGGIFQCALSNQNCICSRIRFCEGPRQQFILNRNELETGEDLLQSFEEIQYVKSPYALDATGLSQA
jgi:hypothetical protein